MRIPSNYSSEYDKFNFQYFRAVEVEAQIEVVVASEAVS